ncbi:hypothetical protein [Streptomyces sp. NPDC094472]
MTRVNPDRVTAELRPGADTPQVGHARALDAPLAFETRRPLSAQGR